MTDDALVAPHLKPLDGPPPPDIVAGSDTSMMDGVRLQYQYSGGREYQLNFTAETVTFRMLSAPVWKPEFAVPVSLPYLATMVREELVMIHWLVPGRSGHVTLLIDLAAKRIFASALMPFKMEMFDQGPILMVEGWKP